MSRAFAGILLFAGCISCAAAPSLSKPVSVFQPQLGLRIASCGSSTDLLPRPENSGGFARPSRPSSGNESVPLSIAQAPTLFEMSGRIKIESLAPEKAEDPEETVLAFRASSPSFSEMDSGLNGPFQNPPLYDSRFLTQTSSNLVANMSVMWKGAFREVMETAPTPVLDGPSRITALSDPFAEERADSARLRGERHFRSLARGSAKESNLGGQVVGELREWRNQPIHFALALAGGTLEQPTPEGGKLSIGPDWNDLKNTDNPAEIFRVRYTVGPLESRAELKQAWVRYRTDIFGNTVFARTAYNYFSGSQSYQLGLQRALGESTSLNFQGGTGIGSESLTGFSPYPVDPREGRRYGIIGFLDHRF